MARAQARLWRSAGVGSLALQADFSRSIAPGQRQVWYPWPYVEGLTMAEATNELAFLVTGTYGHPAPKQHGAPLLRRRDASSCSRARMRASPSPSTPSGPCATGGGTRCCRRCSGCSGSSAAAVWAAAAARDGIAIRVRHGWAAGATVSDLVHRRGLAACVRCNYAEASFAMAWPCAADARARRSSNPLLLIVPPQRTAAVRRVHVLAACRAVDVWVGAAPFERAQHEAVLVALDERRRRAGTRGGTSSSSSARSSPRLRSTRSCSNGQYS